MNEKLKAHIDETNRLAYQFNKQTYINMIVNKFKTDPDQARKDCALWMKNHPLVLSDLGVLVKAELDKAKAQRSQAKRLMVAL